MLKYPLERPDSDTMREIAEEAGVSWDHQAIRYDGDTIGYVGAPSDADVTPIQDASETVVGVRPIEQ